MQNTEEKITNALSVIIDKAPVLNETKLILHSAFDQFYSKLNELKADANNYIVTSESQTDLMKQAKERRLILVKVRTQGIDLKHKELKADSLAYTKTLDEIKRTVTGEIETLESFYMAQEKFAENKEAERIAVLKIERTEMLKEVCENPEMYAAELMPQEAFDNLVNGLKLAKEQKIEAERKVEEERIEREVKEKAVREEQARIEREKAKYEREEAAAKLASEQAEKQRLENELKAKQQAEQEAKDKAAADEEARLSMGDKAKFEELISDMEALKTKHSFKSAKFKKDHADVVSLLDKTINFAISKQ